MPVLDRPIASIDIESTGVDPVKDYIVQFGVCVVNPDGTRTRWEVLIKPPIPIPAEASAIHGITDETVKDAKPFSEYVSAGLKDKHLLGYNLRGLDLPILDEEMRRCGLKLDLSDTVVFDAFSIFCNREPRDLSAAVKKFAGRDHSGAHGALADLAGKLYRDGDGDACYAFGKQRGVKVKDDPGFGYWMLGKDFSGSTKDALRAESDRIEGAIGGALHRASALHGASPFADARGEALRG